MLQGMSQTMIFHRSLSFWLLLVIVVWRMDHDNKCWMIDAFSMSSNNMKSSNIHQQQLVLTNKMCNQRILRSAALLSGLNEDNNIENICTTRRQLIQKNIVAPVAASSMASLLVQSPSWGNDEVPIIDETTSRSVTGTTSTTTATGNSVTSFQAYQVIPDTSRNLNPSLASIQDESVFIQTITSSSMAKGGGTIWLGEHHNSLSDHHLQFNIIQRIHDSITQQQQSAVRRPKIAIGLEQVQIQFQSVLDNYSKGLITMDELREQVQWDKRWVWSFELYQPIFQLAKQLDIQLIALNVNTEDLVLVEQYGLPGLSPQKLRDYIIDAPGFASLLSTQQYKTYVDYVIRPSYEIHQSMGLLSYTMDGQKREEDMTFRNFFSGRILWDESMASNAYKWTSQNPGGVLIGLVGADHVKFQNGIPGRYSRYTKDKSECASVLLNPTLIDTRPSGTVANTVNAMSSQNPNQITLQLRYLTDDAILAGTAERWSQPDSTGGVMPLADYIVIG